MPRTVSEGERALYTALYPSRFALDSSDEFARSCGLPRSPLEDLAAFHVVFGKTVPDVSLNAVANLGYAEARFLRPVWPGDTLTATSEVIGLRETSNGKSGVVWVRSTGWNQRGEAVMRFCRWVMVRKRDAGAAGAGGGGAGAGAGGGGGGPGGAGGARLPRYDFALAGEPWRWGDYAVGERIDHVDRVTIEEAEHMLATRLWQNTAQGAFRRHPARGRPAADLWRARHQPGAGAELQRAGQRAGGRRRSTPGRMPTPALPATRSAPGRRCWTRPRPRRRGSGRCGCARWRRRPARRRSRCGTRRGSTCRRCCSISTTGC